MYTENLNYGLQDISIRTAAIHSKFELLLGMSESQKIAYKKPTHI